MAVGLAQKATTPTTGPNTTGTPDMGAATPTTAPRTTGHLPRTATAPASTATTHSGSTPVAADQSGVRTRLPETAAGWVAMVLGGAMSMAAGVGLRRR